MMKFNLLYNSAEFLIGMIKENCNNADDLSKIALAVESMLEALQEPVQPTTLRQLLIQVGEKVD
jgi:hypothetical protein